MVTRAERLEGKLALVSGGARGQRKAIARSFVDEGAREALDNTGESLAASTGSAAAFWPLAVTDEMSWQSTSEWCSRELGDLKVLVNNPPIVRASPLETTTLDDYRTAIDVNQIGGFLRMRAVVAPRVGPGLVPSVTLLRSPGWMP